MEIVGGEMYGELRVTYVYTYILLEYVARGLTWRLSTFTDLLHRRNNVLC